MTRTNATIKAINDWADRMNKLLEEQDVTKKRMYIVRHCRYGDDNYCDGRPVHSRSDKQRKCPLFQNGKCKLELHKGEQRKNEKKSQ